ncbi:hypothetical protein F5146DRAFT_1130924 [Armillaria mellea]|nr:hypothetical protein F5146DRAFT_1130924 [Armillaria mellea]
MGAVTAPTGPSPVEKLLFELLASIFIKLSYETCSHLDRNSAPWIVTKSILSLTDEIRNIFVIPPPFSKFSLIAPNHPMFDPYIADHLTPPLSSKVLQEAKSFTECSFDSSSFGSLLPYDPFNYEDKYPEDSIYEAAAPNTRVWRTYVESTKHGARMVWESRDSVDVLLVFVSNCLYSSSSLKTFQTGLFSAVMSVILLFEMVLIRRALANGSFLDSVPVSSLNRYTMFTPATADVWVNRLWLTGLSLSSSFDILTNKTSFPSPFKLMLAFIRHLLHWGSLSSFDVYIHLAIVEAQHGLWRYKLKNP